MARKKTPKTPKLYFTDEQIKAKLPPKLITQCGKITYNGVPLDHRWAKVTIFDSELFALLFPVKGEHCTILNTPEPDRDPTDRYLLNTSLTAIAQYDLAQPFLNLIAESFYDEEVLGWSVYCNYHKLEESYYRVAVMFPHEKPVMGHAEYVLPLLTHVREMKRPPLDIQVDWVQG